MSEGEERRLPVGRDRPPEVKIPFEFPLRRPSEWFCDFGAVGGRNQSRDLLPLFQVTRFKHYIPIPIKGQMWGRKKQCHFMVRWAWWKWYVQIGWCYAAPVEPPKGSLDGPERRQKERRQVDEGPPPEVPTQPPPSA